MEIALGYSTLYGDWGGAIAPIGDLTKTEVVAMCHYINDIVFGKEIIPELLLPDTLWRFNEDEIQPSAELKSDQVDPMKFGYHCKLIEAVTDYQKKCISWPGTCKVPYMKNWVSVMSLCNVGELTLRKCF